MLAPWRIVLFEYDDEKRLTRWKQYTLEMELIEVAEFTYDWDGRRTGAVVHNAEDGM